MFQRILEALAIHRLAAWFAVGVLRIVGGSVLQQAHEFLAVFRSGSTIVALRRRARRKLTVLAGVSRPTPLPIRPSRFG